MARANVVHSVQSGLPPRVATVPWGGSPANQLRHFDDETTSGSKYRVTQWSSNDPGSAPDAKVSSSDCDDDRHKFIKRSYRPEFQGLKAIAAIGVVVAHLWPEWAIVGSLSTFYFFSGMFFLEELSRQLVDHPNVPIRACEKLTRSVFSILPEAYITILAICAWVVMQNAPSRLDDLQDGFYASIFFSNVHYYFKSIDYFDRNPGLSPFLPFWSISLMLQVYVVGTLMYAILSRLSLRCGVVCADVTATILHSCIFAVSFTFMTAHLVQGNGRMMHFHALMWLWPFSLGALLGRFTRKNRVSHEMSRVFTIIALALVPIALCWELYFLSADYMLWDRGVFLNYSFCVTVVLVLLAGASHRPTSLLRALTWPLIVHLGDISYVTFLIQWPVMVAYRSYANTFELSWKENCAIILAILLLAHVLHALQKHLTNALSYGCGSTASAGVPGGAPSKRKHRQFPVLLTIIIPLGILAMQTFVTEQAAAQDTNCNSWSTAAGHPGGMLQMRQVAEKLIPNEEFVPSLSKATKDILWSSSQCHGSVDGTIPRVVCLNGVIGASKKVALFGASHMSQWHPAIHMLALKYGWEEWYMSLGGCDYYPWPPERREQYQACIQWVQAATELLLAQPVDYIFVQASFINGGKEKAFGDERSEFLRKLRAVGTRVIALRDTPSSRIDVPQCISKYGRDSTECKMSAAPYSNETLRMIANDPDFTFVDTYDMFCGPQVCEPVIGNVLVYRDDDHITATYIRTLTPVLEMVLVNRVPELMMGSQTGTNATTTANRTTFPTLKLQGGPKNLREPAPATVPSLPVSKPMAASGGKNNTNTSHTEAIKPNLPLRTPPQPPNKPASSQSPRVPPSQSPLPLPSVNGTGSV